MTLLLYLDQRCIDRETAQAYVQEIYYTRAGKPYFALTFASDSGDWERRNPYFKGIYGPKDMTLLHQESTGGSVLVFEGFMDFLSYLTYYKLVAPPHPVIVMNSATMLDKMVAMIRALGAITVHLYLDRDATGRRLMDAFQEQLPSVTMIDESGLYARHKDFNELLQASLKQGLSR